MTDNGFASIVRSLAEGVDPGRVLREVAQEALSRTATSHVVLVAMLEGQMVPLVAIGSTHPVLLEAAGAAFETGQASHRSDPTPGLAALAVPVRHRGAMVAALVVAAPLAANRPLSPVALEPVADCAALALATRPAASLLRGAGGGPVDADGPGGGLALAEALAGVAAAAGTVDGLVAAALDLVTTRFGARAGFVCLPAGPGGVDVVGWRGLDRGRLEAATRHPGFTRLVSGSDVAVVAPTDPVVAQLTAGAELAISLPLVPGEPGALVLLAAEEPDATGRRALGALRAQVAAGLRSAQAAAGAEASSGQLSTVIHSLAEPALAVDADGRFRAVNAAAAELFALSDSFELGRPARGRLGHPGLEGLLLGDHAGDDPTGGFGNGSEVVLGRPTPHRFVASARSLGAAGRILVLRSSGGSASSGSGPTDALAAGLGRALREPLAAITNLASAGPAGGGLAGSDDWEIARKGILAEAARLEAVADQLALLSPAGPDGGRPGGIAVKAEPCDVVAVAMAALEGHRPRSAGRQLTISGPPRLEAVADRRLLERLLDPLIDNALRYSDGPVTVEISDRGEGFEIAVIDAGPGIFSGDIPGLFERYHPLDGSPVRQGAGIGLYTCRRLVELLGGRIWCDSRLGVGSRFAVRLPHAPPTTR
jgi:signal transduction histidine kinase